MDVCSKTALTVFTDIPTLAWSSVFAFFIKQSSETTSFRSRILKKQTLTYDGGSPTEMTRGLHLERC